VNARHTYGENDELIVNDLLEEIPESEEELKALRTKILANPVYRDHYVNEDLTLSAIIITMDTYSSKGVEVDALGGFGENSDTPPPFLTGEEVGQVIAQIDATLLRYQSDDFQLNGIGSPYLMNLLTLIIGQDMFKFSFLSIVVVSLFLFVLYRRVVMIFLPVVVAILSAVFDVMLMAFLEMPVTTAIQIIPSFLIAVGVGNSVHLFNSYYQGIDQGMNKQQALTYAMGHSGLAIVMTGLTTAGGLLSFITAPIKPVSDFGLIAPMGILCTLFFSLVLLPALIAITPIQQGNKKKGFPITQKMLEAFGDFSTRRPWLVVILWGLLMVPALYLASQIHISHFPLHWFPKENSFRVTMEKIGEEMGGATYVEIIVDTKRENGIQDPELLKAIDTATQRAMAVKVNGVHGGKITSIVDINKELHQALNNNDPAFYRIPDDPALVSQELLLFENSGSDDLEQLVDTRFTKARITMKMPWVNAIYYPPYLDELEKAVREAIGSRAEVTFTGVLVMMSGTVVKLLHSTVNSYLLSLLIITPMMVFMLGSLRIGLFSMIPNLAPIIITLGLMQLLGIPLDAFTLLIGSIAIGLAVDDTIHFMHNFQRFRAQGSDARDATLQTLRTTGQAMLFTSLVLASAFFVYLFATMHNLFNFGLLTGFCIIVAFLADVTLSPALVTLLTKNQERSPT
jgi:predicted RND superfamily exporter protein